MNEKLTWEQIKEKYNQQWVQLVDYDWNDTEPYPAAGIVTVHAPTRKEFNNLTKQQPARDAARVFVGPATRDKNVVLNCNLFKVTSAL